MTAEDRQIATTGIACPMCWTPITFEVMEKPSFYALDVLTFGFECETCKNAFITTYEKVGDKAAWKSRVFV